MANPNTLPPGCRFYPSEEQLLCYYLHHKNRTPSPSPSPTTPNSHEDTIKQINLYNYNPFDLPDITCYRFGCGGRKRHWYCFTEKVVDGSGGGSGSFRCRIRRAGNVGGFGYWKMNGKVRDIVGLNKVVVGRRKRFLFYFDNKCSDNGGNGGSRKAVKTDWVMYEYALIDDHQASFVVCRIFVKSRRRCSLSEHPLSSYAEESIATIRHIGIQHDGSILSPTVEDRAHGHEKASAANISASQIETMHTNNLAVGSSNMVDSMAAEYLKSILEGDFLELDDLV